MPIFAESVIAFNQSLQFTGNLPEGIEVMNPFRESPSALAASSDFYREYYNDELPRLMVLGINPGRFGAGLTGVPFTDPKRLESECGIYSYSGPSAHEPSSAFLYEVIRQYGGVRKFYSRVYINSICPLGFVYKKDDGKEVNYNYYDSSALTKSARPFMLECLRQQLDFGVLRNVCLVLGTGKNMDFISKLNLEYGFFEQVIPLEHPRYIIQYKSRQRQVYIDKYLKLINRYSNNTALGR